MELTKEQIKWFEFNHNYLEALQDVTAVFANMALGEITEAYTKKFPESIFLDDFEKYVEMAKGVQQ